MIPLNLNDLQTFLQAKKYSPEFQPQTQQIYLFFELYQQKFPLFVRIMEDSNLLQLLVFMPFNLTSSAISDTARFLHLLNKELDLPGFGMDEEAAVIFYRIMIPALKKEINAEILEAYLNSMKSICESFFPVLATLGQGKATYTEVLKKMKEL